MVKETPFKVNGDVKLIAVSQRQMSAAIGLSPTRINELLTEKVMVRDESRVDGRLMLFESLQNYFLSKKTSSDGVNFWNERALHEKVKRELSELKLAQERGEVYAAAEVEAVLVEMLIDFRNKLTGLGHKLAAQLEGKTAAQICAIIDSEIEQELKELSENVKTQAEIDEEAGAESSGRQSALASP